MDAARRGLQQDASGDSRLNHIDILKGIGIILMVIGHMHYWPNFNKFIFGFHMPLFFWISGYLYHKPTNILIYAMRKVRTLLIPYFIAGLAYSFLDWFRAGWDFEELAFNLKSVFIKTTYDLPIESALWFLFALFWVTLMYAALDVCVRSGTIQILIVIVITTAGCLWTRWLHYLPWGLNSAMSALGFFALGHQYRQRVSQGKEIVFSRSTHINGKIWVGGGTALLFGALIMLNGNLNIRTGSFGILPLSYLNAQVYIFLLYQIAEFLAKVTNKIARRLTDWIALVGRWSIIYVCTNHGALLLGKTFWRPAGLLAGSLGEVFLEFITAMFIMAGIALIVRKTILREVFAL